jgi:phosphopantothenoylcysteine decarboxylase/phosphopantothenate--cysteine ligase
VHLPAPIGAQHVQVRTAQEMLDAVLAALPSADVLIMAAAVADFRPAHPAVEKIKKETELQEIHLERTVDILREVAKYRVQKGQPRLVVGFAAESQDLLANARHKLESKGLDLIVANDIRSSDAGFAVDTNRVTLLDYSGEARSLPLMSKTQVAGAVLERVMALLQKRGEM